MKIRVLKYFLAVAAEGSITRAAHFLKLTQPTLTRQLQELEEELGHKLLVRGKYRVSLTHEGMLLRIRAGEILDMLEKTESEFRTIGQAVSGEVNIGCGETWVMSYVAGIIREIQQEHGQIRFNLYTGNFEDVTEKLNQGFLDFGVIIQPADISGFAGLALPGRDVWGLILRRDSPLAQKTGIRLEDLKGLPLIQTRKAAVFRGKDNDFISWFGDELDKLNVVATYNLIFNAALMVEAGIGYALSLDKLILLPEDGPLCFRPLEPALESEVDLVWQQSRVLSAAARIFLDCAKKKLPQIHASANIPAAAGATGAGAAGEVSG